MFNHRLPDVPIPESDICVTLRIPAHSDYVMLLLGALRHLTLDRHYQRDAARTAKTVRDVWWTRTLGPLLAELENVSENSCDQIGYPPVITCDEVLACLQNTDVITEIQQIVGEFACDDIEYCIRNSITIQQLIQIESGKIPPDFPNPIEITLPEDERNTPLRPYPTGCPRDKIWAAIRYLVDRLMEEWAIDILQDISSAFEQFEKFARALDLIPVLGDAAEAVVQGLIQAPGDLLQQVEAWDSPTTRDLLACEIFQLVCHLCRYPTYNELVEFFYDKLPENHPIPGAYTIEQLLVTFEIIAGFGGEVIAYSMIGLGLALLALNQQFGRAKNLSVIPLWLSFGEDEPDDDWQAFCQCTDAHWRIRTRQNSLHELVENGTLRVIQGNLRDTGCLWCVDSSGDSALEFELDVPVAHTPMAEFSIGGDADLGGNYVISMNDENGNMQVVRIASDPFGSGVVTCAWDEGITPASPGVPLAHRTIHYVYRRIGGWDYKKPITGEGTYRLVNVRGISMAFPGSYPTGNLPAGWVAEEVIDRTCAPCTVLEE